VLEILVQSLFYLIKLTTVRDTQLLLDKIQASNSVDLLSPLIVALEKDQGQTVQVAIEVNEVADDILEQIQALRKDTKK